VSLLACIGASRPTDRPFWRDCLDRRSYAAATRKYGQDHFENDKATPEKRVSNVAVKTICKLFRVALASPLQGNGL